MEYRIYHLHTFLTHRPLHLTKMRGFYVLSLFPFAAIATPNGHCTGSQATGNWGNDGICISTSTCSSYHGTYKNNACPSDSSDIKCCLIGLSPNEQNPCGGLSYCDWTANGCAGTWKTGKFSNCPSGMNPVNIILSQDSAPGEIIISAVNFE